MFLRITKILRWKIFRKNAFKNSYRVGANGWHRTILLRTEIMKTQTVLGSNFGIHPQKPFQFGYWILRHFQRIPHSLRFEFRDCDFGHDNRAARCQDVYKRQADFCERNSKGSDWRTCDWCQCVSKGDCLLYTSEGLGERLSVRLYVFNLQLHFTPRMGILFNGIADVEGTFGLDEEMCIRDRYKEK